MRRVRMGLGLHIDVLAGSALNCVPLPAFLAGDATRIAAMQCTAVAFEEALAVAAG